MGKLACAWLSVSGDEEKSGELRKRRRAKNGWLHSFFCAGLFSRSAFPTILEPGTGYGQVRLRVTLAVSRP